mgnify:CR=1 FL=1
MCLCLCECVFDALARLGLGENTPTIAVFLHGLRLGLRSLERALPAPSQRAAHGHRTHQPNAPPRLVSCMRPTAGARPNHNDVRSQMLPYTIQNTQHLNRDLPQRHAKSRGLAEGSPIARSGLGTDPRVCSPTDPTGPDQGPRNEKKPWKKPHGRALQHQRPSPRSPKDRTESQKSSTSWERTGERIYRGERCEEVSMFISRPSSLT